MLKTIDLHFMGAAHAIASFLLETTDGPVLFETGPHSTLPHLETGLAAHGYQLQDVRHVFLTHIHLDHAGAAWALARHGATVHLHPFGKAHLHDPFKLVASATRIYGDKMEELWGQLHGIPENLLRTVSDQAVITVGDRDIKAHHTPGHAVHHIAWQIGRELVAGDVAGVRVNNGPVVPPCPPPDIQVEHWQQSLAAIKQLDLDGVHLTHYGRIDGAELERHLDNLEQRLLSWANWMKPHYEAGKHPKEVAPLFMDYVQKQYREDGLSEEEAKVYELANPSWMSVAGLMRYWRKKV